MSPDEARREVVERVAVWLFGSYATALNPPEWSELGDYARNEWRIEASNLIRDARVPLLLPVDESKNVW